MDSFLLVLVDIREKLKSGKEKTHKHKQICGIVPGLGGVPKICLCVFFGSFLMGEKKHINKIPPKIPGQSRENFVYVFFSLCVFFARDKGQQLKGKIVFRIFHTFS